MNIELPTLYQQFIHLSRYSRYRYADTRRETWTETVDRYFGFFEEHLSEQCNFKVSTQAKNTLRNAVLNLEIMPSEILKSLRKISSEILKREKKGMSP